MSGSVRTVSLRATEAIPSVIVTESTLSVVPGGIAVVTDGASQDVGPLSSCFTSAEATLSGLRNLGR